MDLFFSSLYIHVPFCVKKCKYCNFYSMPIEPELEKLYIQSLFKEMELTKGIPHLLKTIYIGGGTPSSLTIEALHSIFQKLRNTFNAEKDIEFSVEVNPATVHEEKLKIFREYGVNRLSIGVQSFNDRELLLLGRIHNSEEAIKTVNLIYNSGFNNISIDLIYGIPEQTVDSWYKSLKTAAMLEIKHISIYELTLEKETTLAREINSGRIYLPLENELILMYEKATEFLHSKGFIKYEISNFAKEGFECKHNIVYWRREPYLGLGPSAHSFIGKKRFHNPSNILLYSKSLSENKLSFIDDGEINCLEDLKEYIFLGLRMKEGILVDSPCLIEVFKRFEEQNLVKVSDNRITLTDKGMLVSNEIFAEVLLHIDNCPVCKQE